MPNLPKFTIIIPTIDRAETLVHSLRTCVEQNYDNLTILVSDNVSEDNTQEVVRSFNDSRIKYINPGKRLSMSHHWEYALSHVTNGYASILGDDDGFLPNAVNEAASILQLTGLKAINSKYGLYFWPSVNDPKRANTLHVGFKSGYLIADAQTELRNVLSGIKHYSDLPSIYHSFVHISCIEAAKNKTNNFFHSRIPDVYSGIAIASIIDKYVYSNNSLKIFGASGKSNGAALMYGGNIEIAQRFLQEDSLPIHPLAASTLGRSIGLITGESFLQSFDAGLNKNLISQFDWWVFINMAILEMQTTTKIHTKEIQSNIEEIIKRNNLNNNLEDKSQMTINSKWQTISRIKDIVAIVDTTKYGVENIYDACILYNKIVSNPIRYPEIVWSTLKRIKDTAAFDTLMKSLRFSS